MLRNNVQEIANGYKICNFQCVYLKVNSFSKQQGSHVALCRALCRYVLVLKCESIL